MRILAIGEILWDVFEATECLGGAPLNFSAAAQRLGNSVTLLTAVGDDERGRRALELMSGLGLATDFVQVSPTQRTGTAVVTVDSEGNASYVIERPAAFDDCLLDEKCIAELAELHPQWLYLGTLAQTDPRNERNVQTLVERLAGLRCFYDMNIREGHWNFELIRRLSRLATVVKLNETEAETLYRQDFPGEAFSLERFCREWCAAYAVETICVTLGGKGCAIYTGGQLSEFPGFAVKVVDTVGAGDAFAASFLHSYTLGWPVERQASFANALGALVASRAGATPEWSVEECMQLIGRDKA